MTVPRSFPVFAIVFAVAYAVVYVIAVWKNYALFTYHPGTNEFGLGVEKPKGGVTAMYWYGWIASATVAGFAIATVDGEPGFAGGAAYFWWTMSARSIRSRTTLACAVGFPGPMRRPAGPISMTAPSALSSCIGRSWCRSGELSTKPRIS